MKVIIDKKSGFCFGVKRAIELAEKAIDTSNNLFCLGEIVHNSEEVKRLNKKGIQFIDRETYFTLSDCKVLFRAHGEPPEMYEYARKNNIQIIDATCTVVLKLQEKVKDARKQNPEAEIVIFGKMNHPEVVGLRGQVKDAVILESIRDIEKIDFRKPVFLFAQTTRDLKQYAEIKTEITKRLKIAGKPVENLTASKSICGQVANRAPWLAEFSKTVDAVIFVGGKNSSNSKVLFEVCKRHNPNSFFVTSANDLEGLNLPSVQNIGITGATSTPSWLINEVADCFREVE